MRVSHGRLKNVKLSNNSKGAGIKTAYACGGSQSSESNLEKLREKLSKITIQKPPPERKKYLKFDV